MTTTNQNSDLVVISLLMILQLLGNPYASCSCVEKSREAKLLVRLTIKDGEMNLYAVICQPGNV